MQAELQGIQVFGVSHLAGEDLLKGTGGITQVYVGHFLGWTHGCFLFQCISDARRHN